MVAFALLLPANCQCFNLTGDDPIILGLRGEHFSVDVALLFCVFSGYFIRRLINRIVLIAYFVQVAMTSDYHHEDLDRYKD
jgi:hypothetical protein